MYSGPGSGSLCPQVKSNLVSGDGGADLALPALAGARIVRTKTAAWRQAVSRCCSGDFQFQGSSSPMRLTDRPPRGGPIGMLVQFHGLHHR